MKAKPQNSRAYGTYRNPIFDRGWMHDGGGEPITARVQGGPADGGMTRVHHTWVLGREPIDLGGGSYRLETDVHGFVCVWVKGVGNGS